MLHLAPATPATELRINYSQPEKPVINLAELAEVLASVPEPVRRRTPLDILKNHYYRMAFKKPALIEEVEAVIKHEETRRARPLMTVAR
jgi:hypothetical protein